jgi:hypothetical protein
MNDAGIADRGRMFLSRHHHRHVRDWFLSFVFFGRQRRREDQSLNAPFGNDSLDRRLRRGIIIMIAFVLDDPLVSRHVPLLLLSGHQSAHPQFAARGASHLIVVYRERSSRGRQSKSRRGRECVSFHLYDTKSVLIGSHWWRSTRYGLRPTIKPCILHRPRWW